MSTPPTTLTPTPTPGPHGAAAHNNFHAVRLLAATMVLYSHQHALSGLPEAAVLGLTAGLGRTGVEIFFTLSGYLIFQSWAQDPALGRFLLRRILRIWPGLVVMVALTMLVLGPLVTQWPVRAYFAAAETWDYARAMKVFSLGGPLPGVFKGLPHDGVVNASLWTLPIELRWYLVLAALGVVGLLRRRLTLPLLFVGLLVYTQTQLQPGAREDTVILGLHFVLGALLWQERAFWGRHRLLLPVVAGVGALASLAGGPLLLMTLVALPLASVWVGQASTPLLRDVNRLGDISYGTYIYAFPIQQTVVQFGVLPGGWGYWPGFVLALSVTYALAWLSWRLVEAPALRLKPRRPTALPATGPQS